MEGSILSKIVLPLSLFLIMLGMGMSLIPDDFRRVLRQPKGALVGVLCQMLVLPAVGFLVVKVFDMQGALAVGLLVLAFSPGGVTSNAFTFLARGDVALSISLTAVVSLVSPFTIPLLTNWAMSAFMGDSAQVELPIVQTVLQLVLITIVPVAIGMLLKAKAPKFSDRAEKPMRVFSLVVLFLIVGALTLQQKDGLAGFFARTGWPSLALNVSSMAIGFAVATLAQLKHAQRVTISLEVGIQNGTTALLVTQTLLNNPEMSIAPAIYSLVMFATGGIFGVLINLGREREAATAAVQEGVTATQPTPSETGDGE